MAPSARTVQKAEAKYGVTADYPDLQLHSAAANGNVGLVKYALMHGQPVNSVLNGVLPIHIAASSGNELVVQMLIDAGADVNAARLPRKYNADRSKAISSIGAAGSTPLHFASANGHAQIVTLLLSHGANPELREKHGLRAEDLAREGGHVNVLTVFRLWKQHEPANALKPGSIFNFSPSKKAGYPGGLDVGSASGGPGTSQDGSGDSNNVASSSASIHSVASSTGRRRLLSKPSLESISAKGRKLAKAASNPNLAALLPNSAIQNTRDTSSNQTSVPVASTSSTSTPQNPRSAFAQAPVALRQNPSKSAFTSYMQQHGNASLIHQVINLDKSRRPSLPSVFEKAAHPSQSLKSALGLTPANAGASSGSGGLLGHRSLSTSSRDNDPYHLGRPHRSSSKNSLSGMFRHNVSGKARAGSDTYSQPLSPAASTFFTGDDELEQAERDAFLRAPDKDGSSGEDNGSFRSTYGPSRPASQPTGHYRRTSAEGFTSVRSRAGSTSSAATNNSNRSYGLRPIDRSQISYPMTAPPTQTTFSEHDLDPVPDGHVRPALSTHSSTGNVVIPQAIPAPPSSSTQPFFTKAAISAAHNNPPIARPGFYRPRKSSQLSTAASTPISSPFLHAPDHESVMQQPSPRPTSVEDDRIESSTKGDGHVNDVLVPPALVVRKPTIRGPSTPQVPGDESDVPRNLPASPRVASRDGSAPSSTPSFAHNRPSPVSVPSARHVRSTSETTIATPGRPGPSLPDVQESPESHVRGSGALDNEILLPRTPTGAPESDTHDESTDIFPPALELPASSRSRAGSRSRFETSNGAGNLQSNTFSHAQSSATQPFSARPQPYSLPPGSMDPTLEGWRAPVRGHRSDSVTTDTRTSRSGSLGEQGISQQRFIGFEYSSSPTGSTASYKYHPSTSTTATSIVSSPPGTAGGGTQVTHAQAQSMVKRKEDELLSYDPSSTSEDSGSRRPSLSQQLAAYGDSLAIERELNAAEQHRRNPQERIALTLADPPASAKYSWEILGKETRTAMPVSKGQKMKEVSEVAHNAQYQQKLWTHRMVSPYEVPLSRPGNGHRHTGSTSTVVGSPKGTPSTLGAKAGPSIPQTGVEQPAALPAQAPVGITLQQVKDLNIRNKPSSNLSVSSRYLAPPQSGESDLSVRKSPRLRSTSPAQTMLSPRSSSERERENSREKPSTTYHVVAGPGSEPTDSANSSMVSEPRSSLRYFSAASNLSVTRHRHSRSDPPSASQSPDNSTSLDDSTPKAPQLLRLETVSAPKFHIEQRAAGEAAPSPIKPKFGSKFGKLFK